MLGRSKLKGGLRRSGVIAVTGGLLGSSRLRDKQTVRDNTQCPAQQQTHP
jgi:hypothetical protein